MQGKTVLITGSDGGIGKETTRGLACKGATIVMASIDPEVGNPVCEEIKQESGNSNIEIMHLDLSSLSSIREFVDQFSQKYQQLHVLINNAGIYSAKRQETRDGFERTIGVNYLGHFLFTNLLLPIIKQTPDARIISLSSNAYFQGQLNLDDLHFKKKYHGFKVYATSKLAIVLFILELAEQLKGTGVTANAVHPGHIASNIWNMWPGKWYQTVVTNIVQKLMGSPEDGAQAGIYLASSDEVAGITGKYFDKKEIRDVSPKCKDMKLQKDLWQISEKLTGLV